MATAVVTGELLDRVEKNGWRVATQWGLGIVVCLAVAIWFGWKDNESRDFVRTQLMEQNKDQAQVIAQNGEQLKQNSEQLRSSQLCQENCTRALSEVCKTLDRVIQKLEH